MAVTLSATPYLQTIYFVLTLESDTGADAQLFKPGAAANGDEVTGQYIYF